MVCVACLLFALLVWIESLLWGTLAFGGSPLFDSVYEQVLVLPPLEKVPALTPYDLLSAPEALLAQGDQKEGAGSRSAWGQDALLAYSLDHFFVGEVAGDEPEAFPDWEKRHGDVALVVEDVGLAKDV